MNKQRNTILIILIVLFSIVAIKRTFFSHGFFFHRNVEINEVDRFEEGMDRFGEGMDRFGQAMDRFGQKMDQAGEEIDSVNSVMDSVDSALGVKRHSRILIQVQGEKLNTSPYLIAFHYEQPALQQGAKSDMTVYYPHSSMAGRYSIQSVLDSSATVNVSMHETTTVTRTFHFLFYSRTQYSQEYKYRYTYPIREGAKIRIAADSGTYLVEDKREVKGLFVGNRSTRLYQERGKLRAEKEIVGVISRKLGGGI
jgi:hypothetical protein